MIEIQSYCSICNFIFPLGQGRDLLQLKNLAVSSNARENITEQASALSRQMDLALTWDDVAWLRRVWHGRIVIKGIQGLADARRAHEVLAILRCELENTLRLLGRDRIGALDATAVRKR